MEDFEVHSLGTSDEIRLSRALVASIEQLIAQYGEGIIPSSILRSYKELNQFHDRIRESEKYKNGI